MTQWAKVNMLTAVIKLAPDNLLLADVSFSFVVFIIDDTCRQRSG